MQQKDKMVFKHMAMQVLQTNEDTNLTKPYWRNITDYVYDSGQPKLLSSLNAEILITKEFLDLYARQEPTFNTPQHKIMLRFQEEMHSGTVEPEIESEYKQWQKSQAKEAPPKYEIQGTHIIPVEKPKPSLYGEKQFSTEEKAIDYYAESLGATYQTKQKGVIRDGMRHNIDTTPLHDPRYTYGQMREILYGLEAGIDVTPYLNPSISYKDMKYMRQAITNGADLTSYNDPTKKRLYVDMDGTMAKWKPVSCEEELFEEGFYRNLEPNQNVVDAIKTIIKENPEIEVYTLSAVLTDSKYALKEKKEWLREYIPEITQSQQIFTHHGKDKKDYIVGGVRPNDYLLDDYTNNLTLWEPPAVGIKLLNGINSTNDTWKGNQLDFTKSARALSQDIVAVMNHVKLRDIPPQKKNQSIIEKTPDGMTEEKKNKNTIKATIQKAKDQKQMSQEKEPEQ